MMTEPELRRRDLCLVCNRARATCFCKYAKPFETKTRFIILMHPREFKRQRTGTGRVTRVSLMNSQIIVGEDFTVHTELNRILSDTAFYPMLLYPGEKSLNLSTAEFPICPSERTPLVIIIDATWASARKMLRLSHNLQLLPRISFERAAASRFVIKRQPNIAALSTIEAAYRILEIFDRNHLESLAGKHAALIDTLNEIVDFQLRCAADPNLPSHRMGKTGMVSAIPV